MGCDEALLLAALPFVQAHGNAGHGQKEDVVTRACRALGDISRQQFYRLRDRIMSDRQRKKRCDAGELSLSREEAMLISAYMMSSFRRNGKQLCSLSDALKELRASGHIRGERIHPGTGEILLLSESTVARALRAYDLHPEQLNRPTPHAHLRSPRPNWCWQMDASVCVIYYLPRGGALIREMKESEFYTGKPENWKKIEGQMVIRYLMTDHRTGMLRLHYVLGAESGQNACDHLIRAMQKPADPRGMLWGIPKFLMVDPGSAQTGSQFRRLCQRLNIGLIVNKPGNARAKGQVEQGHNLVEREFEHGLKFLAQEIRGIDDLNRLATLWQRHKNAMEAHSRYGQPRFSLWLGIAPEHLVAPPTETVCRDLAVREPESRKVNGDVCIQWDNEFYSVANVPGVKIGDSVKIHLNPWRTQDGIPEVVLIEEDAEGTELHYPLPHRARDEAGQFLDAAEIGTNYHAPADTVIDANRKEIQKLMAGEDSLAAAEKKLKKNGTVPMPAFAIDPLKTEREADLPAFIERSGTVHELAVVREEPPVPRLKVLERLRVALDRPLTSAENAFLKRRFANGATPAQVEQLIAQFSGTAVEERKAG